MPPVPNDWTLPPQMLLGLDPFLNATAGSPEADLAIRQQPGVGQRRPAAQGGESATPDRNNEHTQSFLDLITPGPLDAAAAVAFGPGGVAARRLGAGAIAGLGMASDAEGHWLNPRQMERLWRVSKGTEFPGQPDFTNFSVRRSQEGSRAGLDNAVDLLQQQPADVRLPLLHPQQYSGEAQNEAFRAIAPQMHGDTGWIRTPDTWLYGLDPSRYQHNSAVFMAGTPGWRGDMARPPVGMPNEALKPMVADPALVVAEPSLANVRGYTVPWSPGMPHGGVSQQGDTMSVFYGHPQGSNIPATTNHEIQHLLQAGRGAPEQYRGTSSKQVVNNNPDLFSAELSRALSGQGVPEGWNAVGNTSPDVLQQMIASGMYRAQPGEWEARSAADSFRQLFAREPGTPRRFDPFAVGWPDFRVK